MITVLVGSRLYGASLPTSDWDFVRIGDDPRAHLSWPLFTHLASIGDPLMTQVLFSHRVRGSCVERHYLQSLLDALPRLPILGGLCARFWQNLMDGRPRQRFHAARLYYELRALLLTNSITYPLPQADHLLTIRQTLSV